MMERIDIRSPGGTVLIGSPASIPAGFRRRLDQHAAIRAIFADPHAVERLRWLWPRLELGGTARNVTDHDLRVTADHAVTSGRLVAVLAPKHLPELQPADGAARPPAPRLSAGGQAQARPAAPAVPEEAGDRIIEALKRSRRHVGPELVKMIDQMLVPSLVIGLITFLLGLVALQFTGPVAAAIDGALIVIAWACAGVAGITAAYQFVEATRLAVAARSPADLDEAGKLYADAFIVLGTVFLAWLLRRISVKRAGGSKAPAETEAAGETPASTAPAKTSAPTAKRGPNGRPSWRQSEDDVGARLGPDYQAQKSYKDGVEVPYGTKGSTRPDFYKPGESIDVKNYKVELPQDRTRLVNNISSQAIDRAAKLPPGTVQKVFVDVRGQAISVRDAQSLAKSIEGASQGLIKAADVIIVR